MGKAVEALPAIAGTVVGAILSFLGKAVGFVAEYIWTLIVFVAGLIGWWLMQELKRIRLVMVSDQTHITFGQSHVCL